MTAMRRLSVLVPAVLLAAATAAADTVVTAKEAIECWVVSCDTSFTRVKLPTGGIRMLCTRDVREVRLSDSSRVTDLAARHAGVRVGWHADVLDTLAVNASPAEMEARCRDMYAALRECGRSDATVPRLLDGIDREDDAIGSLWPRAKTGCQYGACGGTLGGLIGAVVGGMINPHASNDACGFFGPGGGGDGAIIGSAVGCAIGSVIGSVVGLTIASSDREAYLMREHRSRVNDLVRRVNRAIASPS